MIARVRRYRSAEEASSEWRRFGIDGPSPDPVRRDNVFVYVEGETDLLDGVRGVAEKRGAGASLSLSGRRPRLLLCAPLDVLREVGSSQEAIEVVHALDGYFTARTPGISLPAGWMDFDRTLIMGILNATPDSFSDGGRFLGKGAAVKRAHQMVAEGADIIDIGGESTRPGAEPVPVDEELRRVIPVVEELASKLAVPISVDTRKHEVARAAMEAGASIINDVMGLSDPEMAKVVGDTGAPVILMHTLGDPTVMQKAVDAGTYEDVIGDIMWSWERNLRAAAEEGVLREQVIFDPGIGFGKLTEHNLEILRRGREFRSTGRPLLFASSRKSFIGKLTGEAPERRLGGSLGAAAAAVLNGANIIRVHDVKETADTVRVLEAVEGQGLRERPR